MKYSLLLVLLFSIQTIFCQSDTSYKKIASRIFLPSLDVGYLHPNSDLIKGGIIVKTALEYRFKNNNDFFIRLSYDTYNSKYLLDDNNPLSNAIEGTASFTDLFLAPGYRFGDKQYRLMISVMPGIKFYEYPSASIDSQRILLTQSSKSIFTSSIFTTFEYYFDEKSALTISLFQNQVWDKADFWETGRLAHGISVGFITSLL
ncbi:MAG: hypothetical protein MRY83_18530 [Flavobacteriales bacterium]|nr:hypothetical protein [Flavobacteriales bacterium]